MKYLRSICWDKTYRPALVFRKKLSAAFLKLASALDRYYHYREYQLICKHLNPRVTKDKEPIWEHESIKVMRGFIVPGILSDEFILRSAVATVDPLSDTISDVYSVATPGHHAQVLTYMHFTDEFSQEPFGLLDTKYYKKVQGFLTNQGEFVDRLRALEIATKARQILCKHGGSETLYSEDMWSLSEENEFFHHHFHQSLLYNVSSFCRVLSTFIYTPPLLDE